jgi:hypothetical protein
MGETDTSKREMALMYAEEGWPVLPLLGKVPLTKHGVKDATTDEAQITAWWTRWPDANVGLATGKVSGRLVLDIDVKKGKKGDESLQVLIDKHGPLPKTMKSVTASGGWHYVFRMPSHPIKSRMDVGEGLDLLATGSYFVAPPSTIDGKAYCWTESCEVAPCPSWVAALAERSSTPQKAASEDRIPGMVRELFPDGKESNGNWITHCPYHSDTKASFAVKLEDGLFICYACDERGSFEELYAKVKNVSKDEARRIISPPPPFVEELNREHAVVMLGGRCVILNEERDPIHNWKTITFSSPADLKLKYQNKPVRLGRKLTSASEAWLRHPDRRAYRGFVFAPGQSGPPGYYNFWQGFAVTPGPGNCDLMLAHIRTVICGNNEELIRYVLTWLAQAVQKPWKRPGTSLVLRGKQGTGKGILCTQFGALFGPHFKHVTHSRHLVGNFNAHLMNSLIVFADEAYWAGDKASVGVLKALVTEESLPIEFKGKDVVHVKNHVRLLIATNHDWAVPAGFEERRFCVIDVSDVHMQDRAYFNPLWNEMDNGGREAFLDYLLTFDITRVELSTLPQTEALMENKILSMSTAEQFWYEILVRGTLNESDSTWTACIKKQYLHNLYIECAKAAGQSRRSSETVLGMTLKKLCPHVRDTHRPERAWDVGDVSQCREAFDRVLNWPNHNWESSQYPSRVVAASKAMGGPETTTSQEVPLEELTWDQFVTSDDRQEPDRPTAGTTEMAEEGEPTPTFAT